MSLSIGQDSALRNALEDKKIFVRDYGKRNAMEEIGVIDRVEKIGFTMKDEEGIMLIQKDLYA